MFGENFNHGANSSLRSMNAAKYWEEVDGLMEEAIEDKHVDHLMILGSHATDADLLKAISETLKTRGNGKAWEEYFVRPGTAEEYLFAAARGAAQIARYGMIDGFDACIVPETCERVDEGYVDAVEADGEPEL